MTRAGVKARLARLLRRSSGGEEADQLLACLQALGNPPYWALGPGAADAEGLLEAARRETFRVGDRMTRLSVPVEWQQGAEHAPDWRLHLHSFSWLDALLRQPGKDTRPLELACGLVLDWAKSHRPGEGSDSDLAWSAMATAVRAPIFAHLLRACGYCGLLDGTDAVELRNTVIAHGRFLGNDANYASGSDPGLYQDAGLVLVADYLPFLPQAPKWRRHAKRRFISHLRERMQWEDAIPVERSPRSQFRLQALLAGLMYQMGIKDESAKDMLARMAETASWFVMPDGLLPPLGDSDSSWQPPKWAVDEAELRAGSMVAPRSGYAIVKEGSSYLIVSAAYHPEAQRADGLTFCLFCDGTRVIEDAGPGEGSVLIVDGQEPRAESEQDPGTGIIASGQGEQWHAVRGENPLLLSQGVRHTRLFLFQPDLGLVVVDRVDADAPHRYTRLFRLGREVSIDGDRIAGERFQGGIADHSATAQRRRVLRGGEPAQGRRDQDEQRTSVELTSDGISDIFVAAVSLHLDALTVRSVEWREWRVDDTVRIRIAAGGHVEELTVAVAEGELLVAEELVEDVAGDQMSMTGPERLIQAGDGVANLGDLRLMLPGADTYSLTKRIIETGFTERELTEILLADLRPGSVILDVGASVGYFTVRFAERAGPNGLVIAVEPVAGSRRYLLKNIELNGFRNVIVDERAMSDKAGHGEISLSAYRLATGSARPARSQPVEVITVDDLIAHHGLERLDLIKVDIEGAEGRALEGAKLAIKRYQPLVAVEVHQSALSQYGDSVEGLYSLFSSLGYETARVESFADHGMNYHLVAGRSERLQAAHVLPAGNPVSVLRLDSLSDWHLGPESHIDACERQDGVLFRFRLPAWAKEYVVSGSYDLDSQQHRLAPAQCTEIRWQGEISAGGFPSVWFFEYSGDGRRRTRSFEVESGTTVKRFMSDPAAVGCKVGLRLSGEGEAIVHDVSVRQWIVD